MGDTWTTSRGCRWHRTVAVQLRTSCRWLPPYAESNRHWAGRGKILIDRRAVPEYLALIGEPKLPANLFEVVELEDCFPVERVRQLLNSKIEQEDNSCSGLILGSASSHQEGYE